MEVFDGINVIDTTSGKAGSICSMFLSDNGARVLRVPVKQNINRDDPEFATLHRGKELHNLDLKTQYPLFEKLVHKSDVLIEDLLPLDPLQKRIGFQTLKKVNPGLLHCSITPYGQNGSLKNESPISDLIKARTGILDSMPGFEEGSTHVMHPVIDVGAGLLAALGLTSGLLRRLESGAGLKINTSLMAAGLLYMPKATGDRVRPRPVKVTPVGGGPFYSVYECQDGEWIQLGCIHAGFVDIAATVMGIVEVMSNPRYGDGRNPVDEEARVELFGIVKNVMKTKPSREWAELFESVDVPFAHAGTADAAIENQQVVHNQMVHELIDPIYGPMIQYGLPIKFSNTPGSIKGPRVLDSSSEITLKKSLQIENNLENHAFNKLPLNGIKVADITNVIAGPTMGRLLADLGADVLKIEPPYGDISRPSSGRYFHALNANKKSLSIDAKNEVAQKALQKIVGSCDVMVANLRPGATGRMGLDTETLRKFNPKMIEVHVTAFGWDGPFANRPGVDPLAQAWMGLQVAQGGQGNSPSFLAPVAPTDYTAGCMGALGAVMALYAKEKSGLGQVVNTNLLNAGCLLLEGDFSRYKNKIQRRISDKSQNGLSDFHRLYQTSDGWIYVSAEDSASGDALLDAVGLTGLGQKNPRHEHSELGSQLAKAIKLHNSRYWLELMRSNDIPCAESIIDYEVDFFKDKQAIQNDMISKSVLHDGSAYAFSHNLIQFPDLPITQVKPTPLLGEHSLEILREFGIDESVIDAISQNGSLVTS
ncbi:MAG: Crotonobetainyl-CoA:carnitine CoA-transferase CaiB [Chloroflexi bacterium]|jgi:crotonobetainyl-CoA:carnitine CoA-transferase CaiB-like acyl-CoA transferase|nr:MAG: Crotonobetainyl-CoA:carnitine CoA-transferase CaiB [Chloroflexota bacterium]